MLTLSVKSYHCTLYPYFRASANYFTKDYNRIGGKYVKARFHRYTDSSFATKTLIPEHEKHLGILGPIIRAEVGDVVRVTLRNKSPNPVSIFLQGVSLNKSQDGMRAKIPFSKNFV